MASGRFYTDYRTEHKLIRSNFQRFWLVVLAAFLVYLPFVLQNRQLFGVTLTHTQMLGLSLSIINYGLILVIGAVALNLLIGNAGLISLGNAAFFAVGALVGAVAGVQGGLPFPLVLLAGAVVGAGVGALVGLPSVRIRGLYLLLATLALHFIALYVFRIYQVANFGLVGISYPRPSILGFELDSGVRWYFTLLTVTVIAVVLCKNVLRTREGRAFVAIRDQDVAAASVGIDVTRVKLKAFAFSSALVTVAGVLSAYYLRAATDEAFPFILAIHFIAMIIIGGLGSINGAILGALLWQLTPPIIRTLAEVLGPVLPVAGHVVVDNVPHITNIFFGLVIILVLVFRPTGLNGFWLAGKRAFQRWPYTS